MNQDHPASTSADAPADAPTTSDPRTPPTTPSRTDHLLGQILDELRRRRREHGSEFSVPKLMAGLVQVVALGVLFVAFLYRDDTTHITPILLFAIALQTLTISLLIMGRQR